ncbi:type II secretory system protein [Candidatus Scalindua japonica]|uniref:Type II secretory system protein n=1 Tax=Candidatus Scalindua japonica TaxID=1284222 RepID=A0A286TVI0_9BACT|nr:type II secretory system protein [Candidatus Scalindua japonica]
MFYTPAIFSAFLLLGILFTNETGAYNNDSTFGGVIAGTYLLTEADDGGSRFVTITSDGCWFGIHSYQLDKKFSNQQGVWKKTGKREITARTLNFSLLQDDVGSSRFTFTVEFDKTYQRVSGEFSGKLFPAGVDPLDPLAIPIKTFSNTFAGKRLIITED